MQIRQGQRTIRGLHVVIMCLLGEILYLGESRSKLLFLIRVWSGNTGYGTCDIRSKVDSQFAK